MSKQSDAKENQGFSKSCPSCSNCQNFLSKKETFKYPWDSKEFTKESELRCKVGQFKVGKSNWCKLHKFV